MTELEKVDIVIRLRAEASPTDQESQRVEAAALIEELRAEISVWEAEHYNSQMSD